MVHASRFRRLPPSAGETVNNWNQEMEDFMQEINADTKAIVERKALTTRVEGLFDRYEAQR
jgi:hypothetical protein